jgi:phage terminase large subunit GpA-like protein
MSYEAALDDIFDGALVQLSDIRPSDWAEKSRVMSTASSPFPGKFSYDRTPYLRELVDCLAPDHPAHKIAVMKGAQIGFSTGVIENGIGWIIAENPGNILFLTGHADLAEEAMNMKIDEMIDSCGLRPLIRANALRAKNMRTGDTNKSKEFPGGSLIAGSAGNHKLLRQRSVRYGFIDDFDAAKKNSKESGSTTKLIEQRFAAYSNKMKLFYISTPEVKATSNIEPVYLKGDQRKFHIPCPCCGELIPLEWSVPMEGKDNEMAGISWKLDENNSLIEGSVGYICQKCGEFFDDSKKHELLLQGEWRPTAKPSELGYYSYHISSLYAPPGMYDWKHYVREYLDANPPEGKRDEEKHRTFTNLCLGQTYEETGAAPKANDLQKNVRPYNIGTVPGKLSEKDGNGKIILITCACDLNGTIKDEGRGFVDDARLDYEVVAWAESGASYSIMHGSIGTFVPKEGLKKYTESRERWTYEHGKSNSVWRELNKLLDRPFINDLTGREMRIFITGVDTGQYNWLAYPYIDNSNFHIVALKGSKELQFRKIDIDKAKVRHSQERTNLYLVDVNFVKDELAQHMTLNWDSGNDDQQPPGFMNFPTPAEGKYLFKNYFEHFESEHRVIESKDGEGIASKWVRKTNNPQNHFWDVRVYNMAIREIYVAQICKGYNIPRPSWRDYVDIINGKN